MLLINGKTFNSLMIFVNIRHHLNLLTAVFCYAKRPVALDVPMIPVFKVFLATRGKFIDSTSVSIAHQALNSGTTLSLFIVPSSSISTSHFEIVF